MSRVAVVGAGVVGLSTAVNILTSLPTATVTVIADQFASDTTSDGAGGFFRPYMPDIVKGVDPSLAEQWVRDSWQFYHGLAVSPQGPESGNNLVPGICVYDKPMEEGYSLLKSLVADFRVVPHEELQERNLGRYKYGYAFTTVVTQPPKYMAWLMKTFQAAGGRVQRRTVADLTQLASSYDLVVNCCGLRAEAVTSDTGCFPIKGQLVLVDAPWQKEFFFAHDNIYLVPHDNKLIVGGLRDKGDYSMSADPHVTQRIRSRAEELFPRLKEADTIGVWVGLRPGRERGVRVELDTLNCGGGRKLPIVHNYGHGGHGVTLSWGCGIHAARLVKQAVVSRQSRL